MLRVLHVNQRDPEGFPDLSQTNGNHMVKFGVIADDLTGAMDTGLQFTRVAAKAVVSLGPARRDPGSVLVLDTETRTDSPDTAYSKVRCAARQLRNRRIYKKIDSTLRGPIGHELDAVMDELALERALVTPAFPKSGRTVQRGQLLVNGSPLLKTDFASDPLCPPTDDIPRLLAGQSRRSVGHVGLDITTLGAHALVDEIRQLQAPIVVIDAATDHHLCTIAQAAALLGETCLTCGSAGLAGALPAAFDLPRGPWRAHGQPVTTGAPVLLVVGSLRDATRRQVERARQARDASLVELDPLHLDTSTERALLFADRQLRAGNDVVLTTVFAEFVPGRAGAISDSLATIAAYLVRSSPISGLVLTGGAVAVAVCRSLGIHLIEIVDELDPGVPVGRVASGSLRGTCMVTKAGGFGKDDVLVRAVQYLKGEL